MIYKRHCFTGIRLLLVCTLATHLMSCAYTPSIGGFNSPGLPSGIGGLGQVKPGSADLWLPVRSPDIRMPALAAFSGSVNMGKFVSKRTVATIVGAGLVTLYILLPATMGVVTVFPQQEQVGPPPQGFEQTTLTTSDNITLQTWYAPPANGAAIVLIHGAGGSREDVRDLAAMFARHGYGVLALDLRGHGASAGKTNRLGWQSTPDVGAAVAFLQQHTEVKAVGGLGLSLGGEVLLGAASEYPALQAIVADGATRRSLDELLALESERPLYRNFTARVMFATVQMFSGSQPPKPLLDAMREAESTKFFLIAGAKKALEVAFNEMFAKTVGERVTLWIAPDVGHTEAFSRYPAEYEQRVIEFLDDVLLKHQGN